MLEIILTLVIIFATHSLLSVLSVLSSNFALGIELPDLLPSLKICSKIVTSNKCTQSALSDPRSQPDTYFSYRPLSVKRFSVLFDMFCLKPHLRKRFKSSLCRHYFSILDINTMHSTWLVLGNILKTDTGADNL